MNDDAIRLVGIGCHAARPDWKLGPQHHDHPELILITAARQTAEIEEITYSVGVGDMPWFPQGVPDTEWADPAAPASALFLGVACPELPRLPARRVTDTDGRIGQLARWLYAERDRDPRRHRPIANALTQTILAEYLRLVTQPGDPMVVTLRQFMRQHYGRALTLDDLAGVRGLSKFHFLRL